MEFRAWNAYALFGRPLLLNGQSAWFIAESRDNQAKENIMTKSGKIMILFHLMRMPPCHSYQSTLFVLATERVCEEAFFVTTGGKRVQLQYDLDLLTTSAGVPKITATLMRKAIATANQRRDASENDKETIANSICHRSATQQEHYRTILNDATNLDSHITVRGFIAASKSEKELLSVVFGSYISLIS